MTSKNVQYSEITKHVFNPLPVVQIGHTLSYKYYRLTLQVAVVRCTFKMSMHTYSISFHVELQNAKNLDNKIFEISVLRLFKIYTNCTMFLIKQTYNRSMHWTRFEKCVFEV